MVRDPVEQVQGDIQFIIQSMYRAANSPFEETLFSETTAETARGVLLAVMNVEIRPGQKDKIFIHQFDNQYQLAEGFIHKHGLPQKALPILQNQIHSNKLAVKQSILPTKPDDSYPSSGRNENRRVLGEQRQSQNQPCSRNSQKQVETSRYDNSSNTRPISLSKSRSTADITNRLYNENIMKSKYLFEVQQKALEKLERMKGEATTYTPEINVISNVLASDRRKSTNIQDHLVELGNQRTQRKERAASLKVKKQLEECPFKPSLNRMSTKLTTSRPSCSFSKAIIRNTDQAYDNLFKPALNKISTQIMENKSPFIARQKEYQEAKQAKINRMYKEKKANETIDPKTGLPFFQPTSSKYQPKVWNQNDLEIGEYLYQKGRVREDVPIETEKLRINRYSEELVRTLHAKRIVWIFGELDSDQDGFINSEKVNIQTIPDQILEIIKPILFEMEEFGFQLNLDEFRIALENLHRSLTTTQKSILYNYNKKRLLN